MLGAAWGYEIERQVGRPADILVREGPPGRRVALSHYTLAHEVDPAHDKEREDDADDGPDGAAVGWAVVRGRLGDLCRRTDRRRSQEQALWPQGGRCVLGGGSAWAHTRCRRAGGRGPPGVHGQQADPHCPCSRPGAPSSSSAATWLNSPYFQTAPQCDPLCSLIPILVRHSQGG